jgi:hypothetical protein
MIARPLFCALSERTDARTEVAMTKPRTIKSLATLLATKDNRKMGPRTKMQKDKLTRTCSVRRTASSEYKRILDGRSPVPGCGESFTSADGSVIAIFLFFSFFFSRNITPACNDLRDYLCTGSPVHTHTLTHTYLAKQPSELIMIVNEFVDPSFLL